MGESGTNAHYAAEAQVQGGLPEDGEARSRGVGRIKGGNAWKSPLAESGSSWCSFGDACYAYGSASLFPVGTQKDRRLVSTPGIGARAADSAFLSYRHRGFCVSLFSLFTRNSEADAVLADVRDFRACLYPGCVSTSLLASFFRLAFPVHSTARFILSRVYPRNVL